MGKIAHYYNFNLLIKQ